MPPPPPPLKRTLYTGTFISTPTPSSLSVLENHAVVVDEKGVIIDKIVFPRGGERGGEGGGEKGGEEGVGGGEKEGEGESEGVRYEDLKNWVERKWGVGVEWEWVQGGRGWWFPGFVGECGGFFGFGFCLVGGVVWYVVPVIFDF